MVSIGTAGRVVGRLVGAEVGDRGDVARVADHQQRRQVDARSLERREQRRIAAGADGDEGAAEAEGDVVRARGRGAGRPGQRRQAAKDAALHAGADHAGDRPGGPVAALAGSAAGVGQAQRARAAASGFDDVQRAIRAEGHATGVVQARGHHRRRLGACRGGERPGSSTSSARQSRRISRSSGSLHLPVSHRRPRRLVQLTGHQEINAGAGPSERTGRAWGVGCSLSRARFPPRVARDGREAQARRARKNACITSRHSSSSTPPTATRR